MIRSTTTRPRPRPPAPGRLTINDVHEDGKLKILSHTLNSPRTKVLDDVIKEFTVKTGGGVKAFFKQAGLPDQSSAWRKDPPERNLSRKEANAINALRASLVSQNIHIDADKWPVDIRTSLTHYSGDERLEPFFNDMGDFNRHQNLPSMYRNGTSGLNALQIRQGMPEAKTFFDEGAKFMEYTDNNQQTQKLSRLNYQRAKNNIDNITPEMAEKINHFLPTRNQISEAEHIFTWHANNPPPRRPQPPANPQAASASTSTAAASTSSRTQQSSSSNPSASTSRGAAASSVSSGNTRDDAPRYVTPIPTNYTRLTRRRPG